MQKLEEIYVELKGWAVSSQYEFSTLFGKQPSYFSSLKAKGTNPSIDALCHFAIRIDDLAHETLEAINNDPDNREAYDAGAKCLEDIAEGIWIEIRRRVRE